jgi:hypothetical protein
MGVLRDVAMLRRHKNFAKAIHAWIGKKIKDCFVMVDAKAADAAFLRR